MALKILQLANFSEIQLSLLRYNLKMLLSLDHPNIVKVKDWHIENDQAYILSPYVQGGEYFDRLIYTKQITEKTVALVI